MELCAGIAGRKKCICISIDFDGEGRVVSRARWFVVCQVLAIGLSLIGFSSPAHGQGLQTEIEARGRVLPGIGPGVTTLKRDSAGHYYVLAKPANVIWVYDADGKLAGQIPNARSGAIAIHYAVDFDISPEGKIVVADRGANAIEVFAPDGTSIVRVPVNAPTSVVALSGGQFAVTSLTSKRLVQVLDEQGNYVRSFGDPTEVPQGTDKKPLADLGRISGDSDGHILFAFTTVDDPTFRQYDRYGYVAYEATVPEQAFEELSSVPTDRVEFGFNIGEYSLYDQTQTWVSLGSSGDLKYGGGVGTGLLSEFNRGGGFGGGGFGSGGFGRGGMMRGQAGVPQSGMGGFGGGLGSGPLAGVFSGQVSKSGSNFQVGMGTLSGGGRGRGGSGGGSSANENTNNSSAPSGFSLSFFGNGNHSGADLNDPNFDANFTPTAQDFSVPQDAQATLFGDVGDGSPGDSSGSAIAFDPSNQGGGITGAYIVGSTFNSFAFRGRDFGGAPGAGGGPPGTPRAGVPSSTPGFKGPVGETGAGAGAKGPGGGFPHYGGHFGGSQMSIGASVRVNLGDLGSNSADKPIITAVAVDPTTQEVWAGIGDMLVHFNKQGEPIEMFSLTLKGGTHLKPTAILIEPNRFLIAADPWGIYEFAPPDGPAIPSSMRVTASPAEGTPQQ
jgi:hypothetical protein